MTESNVGIDLEYYRARLDLDNEEHHQAFKRLEQLVRSNSDSQDLVQSKDLVDVEDRFWNTIPETHYSLPPLAVESYREFKDYTSRMKRASAPDLDTEQINHTQQFLKH